ncbi:CCA tRNA nucleotidyltransferase [Desulfoluna spongiiphila]|uniref:tRNA nucleotidyltransferase (CCA-adding enzyme) n=1 Tax=Desulfoluna spongiiphila TaxID=419481 RepID=A0A1G5JGX3_9BACT|nr:CCA tRNA nucleotidyltransferase [Desulfoluna spongiiphila]SCY87622.1 tRNA nucleotidyltransferase (CCA-adding enzyme) [Desulfoluna spongiiphila]VVS94928.1 poly a polymerase head domain [Desulfoluna spongiiphila]
MNKMNIEPEAFAAHTMALTVLSRLRAQGFQAVVAGGAVRDSLLGRPVRELDIATSASAREVTALFAGARVEEVGRSFPLVLVNGVEVATFRGKTLEEDLLRRDLTFNAMAWCPDTHAVIDPWGGAADLEGRIVRFTGDPAARIQEDPLRLLRAARFVAELSGRMANESLDAMAAAAAVVAEVAPERIHHEIIKAMAGETPSLFFETLRQGGLLRYLFPEMEKSVGHDGGFHHDETVWEHMMLATDAISPKFPLLRLAMALHDVAKPQCVDMGKNGIRFLDHEKKGEPLVDVYLERLGFSNQQRAFVSKIVRHHMRRIDADTTPKAVRRILRDLHDSDLPWRDWMRGVIADGKANKKKQGGYSLAEIRLMVDAVYAEISPKKQSAFSLAHLAVSGTDLITQVGIPQGPVVGRVLKALLDKVIESPELNDKETLLKEAALLAGKQA